MKEMIQSLIFALAYVSAQAEANSWMTMPMEKGSTNVPCISVFTEPGFRDGGGEIVTIIWPDGRAVWSTNGIAGGPPYFQAQLSAGAVKKFLDDPKQKNAYTNQQIQQHCNVAIDSDYSTITIISTNGTFSLTSSHELFERGTNFVGMSFGMMLLQGQSREEALSKEPASFLAFRQTWKDLRAGIQALLPSSGSEITNFTFSVR